MLEDLERQPVDIFWAELGARAYYTFAALGINGAEAALMQSLLTANTPWPERSLALSLAIPRTTLRRAIDDLIVMGIAMRGKGGIMLTKYGRILFKHIWRETRLISYGGHKGFSKDLLYELRSLETEGVRRPFVISPDAPDMWFPRVEIPKF